MIENNVFGSYLFLEVYSEKILEDFVILFDSPNFFRRIALFPFNTFQFTMFIVSGSEGAGGPESVTHTTDALWLMSSFFKDLRFTLHLRYEITSACYLYLLTLVSFSI